MGMGMLDLTRPQHSSPKIEKTELNGLLVRPRPRVRVNGKRLACGERDMRVQGVTYGPFGMNADADPFPSVEQVRDDFTHMRGVEINAVRTYHLPPDWLLHLADEHAINIFVDVPWPKHLCFLDSARTRADARRLVEQAAKR